VRLFAAFAVALSPLFLLSVHVASARADGVSGSDGDRATARTLGEEGQEALERRDYANAADRFARADALFHAPTLTLGLARASAGLGRLVAAQEAYNRIVRDGAPPGAPQAYVQAIESARAELAAIAPRIGRLVVRVTGADAAEVTLDGVALSSASLGVRRTVDPGAHVVRAMAKGFRPVEVRVSVAEGAVETASLVLESDNVVTAPVAPVSTSKAVAAPSEVTDAPDTATRAPSLARAYVAFGAAGAGAAVGAITGLMALGKASDLETQCPAQICPEARRGDVDTMKAYAIVSTIGFGVMLVGAAVGTYLVLAPSRERHASVVPYLAIGSVGVRGYF
jgi:hypothetical protein